MDRIMYMTAKSGKICSITHRAALGMAAGFMAIYFLAACGNGTNSQGLKDTDETRIRVIVDLTAAAPGVANAKQTAKVVQTIAKAQDTVAATVKQAGGKVIRRYQFLPQIALEANGGTIARLLMLPEVEAIRPDREVAR